MLVGKIDAIYNLILKNNYVQQFFGFSSRFPTFLGFPGLKKCLTLIFMMKMSNRSQK